MYTFVVQLTKKSPQLQSFPLYLSTEYYLSLPVFMLSHCHPAVMNSICTS